jgi:S1-C subfamily serine protease
MARPVLEARRQTVKQRSRAVLSVVALAIASAACASRPPPAAAPSAELTPAQIVERTNASVVRVQGTHVFGTGFVVGEGRIATNFHVVEGQDALTVILASGEKRPVTDIWLPPEKKDLAVLKVDTTGLAPLRLASAAPRLGEHVVAIGNPEGMDHTVSDGVVGAVRPANEIGARMGGTLIQHSAPVSHGSSGGPLFNTRGEVIGVNTLVFRSAQNLNFAVPSSELAPMVHTSASPLSMAEFRATGPRPSDPCNVDHPDAETCLALCTKERPDLCNASGIVFRRGRGVSRDDARAAELYRKACDAAYAPGCANLGVLYRAGEGVARDLPRALSLSEDACDRGYPGGCLVAGEMLAAGEGAPASLARAVARLSLACDGGLGDACMKAGSLFEKGKARKLEKAVSFYQRGCDHGWAKSCTHLGVLLTEGSGLTHERERAVRLFERGCERNDPEACGRHGAALLDGNGITPDRERGAKEIRWACSKGHGASCERTRMLTQHPASGR